MHYRLSLRFGNQGSCSLTVLLGMFVRCQLCIAIWVPAQPKENIWVTIANKTGQEAICLMLSSPGNPFSTCLVGMPLDVPPCPPGARSCQVNDARHYADNWDRQIPYFPPAPLEPQELEILGSVKADWCVFFNWTSIYRAGPGRQGQNLSYPISVNSTLPVFRNASGWCNYTSNNVSLSSNTPIALPYGVFLICRDRVWAGVPSKLEGGPCTLGRLTLLTPNVSIILQYRRKLTRIKRVTHAFTPECNDNVQF